MGKKYTTVSDKEYTDIKLLQNSGIGGSRVSSITGRSIATVYNIFKSDTFDDYRNYWRKQEEAKQAKKQVKVVERKQDGTHNLEEAFIQALQNINDTIVKNHKELNDKLTFIENNVVVQPKRRLW